MNPIFTSSKTDEWTTPDWLFKQLDDEFHFEMDMAATKENTKCSVYFSKHVGISALKTDWWDYGAKVLWCNPPYNNLEEWIKHGYEASLHGCTVVYLLPTTKTDQRFWHEIVLPNAAELRFIRGRVKFGGSEHSAPFPSIVVVFKPDRTLKIGSLDKHVQKL